MKRVHFSGEMLSEIWIALPERIEIAVREAREAGILGAVVAGKTAAAKRVSVGVLEISVGTDAPVK